MTVISRKLIGLLFFIIMLMGILVATPFWAQTGAPEPGQKWEETPYLWAGKTLEELRPSVAKNILPKYGELRFVYPSADSCLAPPETKDINVLGRDLIWYELATKEAVEVCLFRIFAALGDQAKIETWLVSQGFGSKFETDSTRSGFLYGVEDAQITSLTMMWRTAEQGARYGSTIKIRRSLEKRVKSQTVNVTITEGGRVLSVQMGPQSYWTK